MYPENNEELKDVLNKYGRDITEMLKIIKLILLLVVMKK